MEKKTAACRICGKPTKMLGTRLCDRCWELETRIEMAPDIAKRILAALDVRAPAGVSNSDCAAALRLYDEWCKKPAVIDDVWGKFWKWVRENAGKVPIQLMPVCPQCGGETTVRDMGNGKYKCFACINEWSA